MAGAVLTSVRAQGPCSAVQRLPAMCAECLLRGELMIGPLPVLT